MSEEAFYIKLTLKGGEPNGNITVSAAPPDENQTEQVGTTTEHNEEKKSKLAEIFLEFQRSMLNYMDMLPHVAAFAPMVAQTVFEHIIRPFVVSNGEKISENDEQVTYKLPLETRREWDFHARQLKTSYSVGRQVPKMILLGIVSSFEHFQSTLFSEILSLNPGKYLSDDRTVTLADLTKFDSVDEIKRRILEKEVENIMRDSFVGQIKKFESIADIKEPISRSFAQWAELVEIFERRNLFAHANGRVNEIYISKLKLESVKTESAVGDELSANQEYLDRTMRVLTDFGTKLIHIAWRKLSPAEHKDQEKLLGSFCYELMQRDQLELAESLLRFSLQLREKKNGWQELANTINLASCLLLREKSKEGIEVMDSKDWDIHGTEFQISAAALRNDLNEVIRLMRILAASDTRFGADIYEDWPVFFSIRHEKSFQDAFAATFGRPYSPAPRARHLLSGIAESAASRTNRREKIEDAQSSAQTSTRH